MYSTYTVHHRSHAYLGPALAAATIFIHKSAGCVWWGGGRCKGVGDYHDVTSNKPPTELLCTLYGFFMVLYILRDAHIPLIFQLLRVNVLCINMKYKLVDFFY